jgi:hypothetical protein
VRGARWPRTSDREPEHQHPSYYSGADNPHDVAVVVLDKPVKGATARIAPLGLLDTMKAAGTLNQSTAFTSVGYGSQETKPPHGWGVPGSSFTYLDTREWAIGYFNSLGKGYMTISQNLNAGSGGTCYGGSGRPQFLGGTDSNLQVSVTVTGDVFCKSTNKVQRLDIFSVQSWLSQFGVLGYSTRKRGWGGRAPHPRCVDTVLPRCTVSRG